MRREAGKPRAVYLVIEQEPARQQGVVAFVDVARVRPHLVADTFDRGRIECPDVSGVAGTPRLNRLCSTLLEWSVVHECVGPRIQNVVTERRRLRRVTRDAGHFAGMDPLEHPL